MQKRSDPAINTSKASGKLKYKKNSNYKIKGLYVATTFNTKGNPVFKKVTNGARILLATTTNYSATGQKTTSDTQEKEYGVTYDYLHPVTLVKVKYYDKLLKITAEEDSDDRVTTVTPLFPATEIRITVKEKATKEIFTQTFTLYTLSK